ncbi:MAG: alpha/beta hydrolase, partial [Alphaproteobacteria bacterium]|nr:alpha/beta hydrolase [Alphaproteobacteria bacterium]
RRKNFMADITFNGPDGKLEGKYTAAKDSAAPLVIVLHQHPKMVGNMDNKIVFAMYQSFVDMGFSAMRFNFRGVGKSAGVFDEGTELGDVAAAFDWLQDMNKEAKTCWVAGHAYGAWTGMQLLMRRPEIVGFVAAAPPANTKDFSFLAPCPTSGLIMQGGDDAFVNETSVRALSEKLSMQRGIKVDYVCMEGANHEFNGRLRDVYDTVTDYVKKFKPAAKRGK